MVREPIKASVAAHSSLVRWFVLLPIVGVAKGRTWVHLDDGHEDL